MAFLNCLAGPIALAGLIAAASPLSAQVLEIGGDGSVTTFDGPAVTTLDGQQPIALAAEAAPGVASAPVAIETMIAAAARDYRIDPALVRAVAWHESRYRQQSLSSKGAIGVMQLMPGTARTLGVDPYDTEQNIRGGAAFLAQLSNRYRGDLRLTLAAYSAGPGAVARYGGVPPYAETQAYVTSILDKLGQSRRFALAD